MEEKNVAIQKLKDEILENLKNEAITASIKKATTYEVKMFRERLLKRENLTNFVLSVPPI